ncbi:MAG: hypothetical protein AAF420_00745, partial [Pseudomonadota bacterium]
VIKYLAIAKGVTSRFVLLRLGPSEFRFDYLSNDWLPDKDRIEPFRARCRMAAVTSYIRVINRNQCAV